MSKARDDAGHGNTGQQGDRQLQAVMGMELEFRQQIGTGNAKKCPGGERQRASKPFRV